MDPEIPTVNRKTRISRLSLAILVAAAVIAAGMFVFSRDLNQRNNQRLLSLEAREAKTSIVSLIAQIESTLSSEGSVAAATNANPASLQKLETAIPELKIFSTLTVLRVESDTVTSVVEVQGNPNAPLGDLTGAGQQDVPNIAGQSGVELLGYFGHGSQRRLAMTVAAPAIPSGYLVYAEIPLPPGAAVASGFPELQDALYLGRTENSPVLFASSKDLPLHGNVVTQMVDMNDLYATTNPKADNDELLFVVGSTGSDLGTLTNLLPWILAGAMILVGILVVVVVESTARRRDSALKLVGDLEQKNAELDRAMAEQAEGERTRIRLENELRQSQRLEAIGQLAGGVAHDFNNLLMVIQTHSNFMAEELPPDHPAQEDLAEVRTAAQRAAELTRQLLVFSRRDLIHPSVLEVNDTIAEALGLLRRTLGEQIRFETLLSPDLPRILADPGELQQVVMNLIVNARQAIESDGIISIETSEQLIDEDAASVHAELHPGHYVRIAVTDSGCGMDAETLGRIFEPYFTTKEPGAGTGLGLSTVYGIVNRYGGCVTVYSELDVGTTFNVYLPSTDQDVVAPTDEDPKEAEAQDYGSGTVLLVEDEAGVRNACRRILERAGFSVIEARDGTEALALAHVDALPIDLLLTDVVMPGGMSGREVAENLEQLRPGVPVLFMSGYNANAIATRGVLEPGINVVEKPFTSTDLLSKVRELLVVSV